MQTGKSLPCNVNEEKASEILGLSVKTLRKWRCEMRGPHFIKFGEGKRGRVVYSEADLAAWIDQHRVETDA
jgi:hypothetical protein